MALEILHNHLTEEEYLNQRYLQNPKTGHATQCALTNFKLFSKHEMHVELDSMMNELRDIRDPTDQINKCLILLQKFTNWLALSHPEITMPRKDNRKQVTCKAKDVDSIKNYIPQIRLYLRKVGGIRITSEDVSDFINFPSPSEKEEVEPLLLKEFKKICSKASDKRCLLYRITKDCEARMGAMVQLRKKHFNTQVRPIEVTFPKHIMKKKNGISYTNVKYVITEDEKDLLDLLAKLGENDLVFGTNEDSRIAMSTEEQMWARLMIKVGLDAKYEHNGRFKKNMHSIKSLTFTAAEEAVNETYAHSYGDHTRYTKNYLRWTKEKKIEKFRKLEKLISIYTEYERVTDDDLIKQNNDLEKKLSDRDQMLTKMFEESKINSRKIIKEEMQKLIAEKLKENNII